MQIHSDFRELLKTLNKHKVKYLIVGAYAAIYYAEPRYTKDLDIWIESSDKNSQNIYSALKEFGAPLKGISPKDFVKENLVYQIGVAPIRVDIIMGIAGLRFDKAWKNRIRTTFDGIKVNIIGLRELIRSKEKAMRDTNHIDIKNLKNILKSKKFRRSSAP